MKLHLYINFHKFVKQIHTSIYINLTSFLSSSSIAIKDNKVIKELIRWSNLSPFIPPPTLSPKCLPFLKLYTSSFISNIKSKLSRMLYTPFTFQFFPSSLAHNIANFSSPCPGSVAPPRPAIPALLDSPTHHTECTSAENSLLLFVFQPLPFKKQFTQQLLTKASPKSPPTVGKTMFSFPSFR